MAKPLSFVEKLLLLPAFWYALAIIGAGALYVESVKLANSIQEEQWQFYKEHLSQNISYHGRSNFRRA